MPDNAYLHLLAVDLARSPDGQWWVLSDRTQAPSGAGYALENRIVLAETFPDLFREFQVQRLASFFRAFRNNMLRLSTSMREQSAGSAADSRAVQRDLLRAFLSRPLSRLHAGAGRRPDGARQPRVSENARGLKQVDVILRRVDDSFCDPIELRSDSFLGVAGLVEAVRAGNVVVANALGSGLIESPAFMPFLPGLSRRLLGERLKLPSVATWWCGQPQALDYVLENLDSLVIKPAFPAARMEPVFGGKLAGDERRKLLERMRGPPLRFRRAGTAAPLDGAGLVGEHAGAAPRGAARLPGGGGGFLGGDARRTGARVSPSLDSPVVSMQRGGGSKDTWVLSEPRSTYSLCSVPATCRWN